MKVYRLEKDDFGPYRYPDRLGSMELNDLMENLLSCHCSDTERPAWAEEPVFHEANLSWRDVTGYRSACSSLQDLIDWFGEFFDDLLAAGFEVKTYFAEEYVVAHNQLIFKIDTAHRIII